jgi:hypothetical protein
MDSKKKKAYERKLKKMSDNELYKTHQILYNRIYNCSKIDKTNPRPTGWCCFCQNGRAGDKGNYIQCLKCDQWDHVHCSGIPDENANYICPVCDPTKHRNAPGFKLRPGHSTSKKKTKKTTKAIPKVKKKKKKRPRYGEDNEYSPVDSPTRKRKLDVDDDMEIHRSPKRSKKAKQKKGPITVQKVDGLVSKSTDYSKYQKVENFN